MSYCRGLTNEECFSACNTATRHATNGNEYLFLYVLQKPLLKKLNEWGQIHLDVIERDHARDEGRPFDEAMYPPATRQAFRELDTLDLMEEEDDESDDDHEESSADKNAEKGNVEISASTSTVEPAPVKQFSEIEQCKIDTNSSETIFPETANLPAFEKPEKRLIVVDTLEATSSKSVESDGSEKHPIVVNQAATARTSEFPELQKLDLAKKRSLDDDSSTAPKTAKLDPEPQILIHAITGSPSEKPVEASENSLDTKAASTSAPNSVMRVLHVHKRRVNIPPVSHAYALAHNWSPLAIYSS